jgi:Cytochrome c3
MPTKSHKSSLLQSIFALWLLPGAVVLFHTSNPVRGQSEDNCSACHRQQKDNSVFTIFKTSTHGRGGITCNRCHGGDPSQAEKTKAHTDRFVGKPDTAGTLEMCGRCHRQALEFFKGSRHVAARPNAARLDCVECHGVHAIGAYSESFRWAQFCAGCHGLEYLPPLPRPFQDMLSLADDLSDGLHRLDQKGGARPELTQRRKEIRHMTSELVHQTDSKGGVERIPRILELGATLKQQIASEEKR